MAVGTGDLGDAGAAAMRGTGVPGFAFGCGAILPIPCGAAGFMPGCGAGGPASWGTVGVCPWRRCNPAAQPVVVGGCHFSGHHWQRAKIDPDQYDAACRAAVAAGERFFAGLPV
jgi:hypothetical protein